MFGGLVIGSHGLVSSEQRTSRVTWALRPHLAGHWMKEKHTETHWSFSPTHHEVLLSKTLTFTFVTKYVTVNIFFLVCETRKYQIDNSRSLLKMYHGQQILFECLNTVILCTFHSFFWPLAQITSRFFWCLLSVSGESIRDYNQTTRLRQTAAKPESHKSKR